MKLTMVLLLLFSLWALSEPARKILAAGHACSDISADSQMPGLSKEELKDLRKKLAASSATSMVFQNDPAAPLVIKEAAVRFVKIEAAAVGSREPGFNFDSYVTGLRVSLMNTSSTEVKGLVLHLSNDATAFSLYRRDVTVAPGKNEITGVDFMCVRGEPSTLVVTLTGARLTNGILWGNFPTNPPIAPQAQSREPVNGPVIAPRPPVLPVPPAPPTPPPSSQNTSTQQGARQEAASVGVDSRPIPLNRPRPNYTELARRNGVGGTALLRLLIGADGAVKQVRVRRALPDFLTEEAIRVAYELRFKPAMKSGQPVAFWQSIEVEFNLR